MMVLKNLFKWSAGEGNNVNTLGRKMKCEGEGENPSIQDKIRNKAFFPSPDSKTPKHTNEKRKGKEKGKMATLPPVNNS